MHPVIGVAIAATVVVVAIGGYQAINTLYEWHRDRQEQREYEEYVRMHTEKSGRLIPVTIFENQDDEDSEDDEPLAVLKKKRESLNNQNELRRRKMFTDEDSQEHEFNEKEATAHTTVRYDTLAAEPNPFADGNDAESEIELEKQHHLLSLKGNTITGIPHDDTDSVEGNPFADDFLMREMDSPQEIQTSDIKDYVNSFIKRPSDPEVNATAASSTSTESIEDVNEEFDTVSPTAESLHQSSTDNFTSDEEDYSHQTADVSENDSWSDIDDGRLSDRSNDSSQSTESFESIQHPHL